MSGYRYGADLHASADAFCRDITRHEMTVLLDQDGYRHLRFQRRNDDGHLTSMYYFDIITWPGNLVVTGDMGTYHFAREHDMVGFFAPTRWEPSINPGYWAEKLRGSGDVVQFSQELFEQRVNEYVDQWLEGRDLPEDAVTDLRDDIEDLAGEVDTTEAAYDRLYNFSWQWRPDYREPAEYEFQFEDAHEMTFDDWTRQYLWCCYAIVWGLARYLHHPSPPQAAVPPSWAPQPKPKEEPKPAARTLETVAVAGGVL